MHNRKIKIGRTFPPVARSRQPNRATLHLVTPGSSGTTGWSHLPWKPPAPNSLPRDARVRATPPAGRGLRSYDLPPRPFQRAPHFAVRVSIPALTLSSGTRAPPHSRPTFLRTRPPRLPAATHGESTMKFPSALPPSEDRPGACGAEPQRALRVAGKRKGDRCALKVNSNTACKLLGCSPERAPAGTLPQRRALPRGLPRQ